VGRHRLRRRCARLYFAYEVKFNGIDIFDEERLFGGKLKRSGISYSPELEWILASQWAHYRYEEFEQLSGQRQSALVAAYRAEQQMKAVLAEHSDREMKRRQAQAEAERLSNPKW